MSAAMWITVGILTAAILLFITEWLAVDLVAMGVVLSLMILGILTPEEALGGFSSPIVITVAALFMVGGAVLQTGLADTISQRIIALAGKSTFRLLIIIMGTVALMSGFISDTGTVAVMAPAIISIGRKKNISPSKLLIPLSYGALLGGSMTLIGTPPNIIVSDLLIENGYQAFQFFDFTPIGFSLLLTGIAFITLTSRWLLPDYRPSREFQRVDSPEELVQLYKLPDDLFRLRVRGHSPLINQTIQEADLRNNFQITILEILRQQSPKSIARMGDKEILVTDDQPEKITPSPATTIQSGDILICQGKTGDISLAAARLNLGVQPAEAEDQKSLVNNEVGVAEVLLPPRSRLIGKTLTSSRFGSLYKMTVLGINRPGAEKELSLKNTRLQFGDTLFVQGPWKNIADLQDMRRDFVVVGQPEALKGSLPRSKMILAGLILTAMLVMLITNWLPLSTTAMLAAFLMVITGCLEMKEAYNAVDWKSIILIAGMLPMTTALQKVGLVDMSSAWMADTLGTMGVIPILATLFLVTSLFTQVISNTATTVLIAPVALSLAVNLGYQPQPFLLLVAFAASTAFASPVASPVNTLVMGTGNYRFRDYLKIGGPLILLSMLVILIILPLLWPLR
ncbi:MAG: SLC13 family permease [Anaerolineales bacterium]|nr:SLC13 family permease [Anaerolineales bacterium]